MTVASPPAPTNRDDPGAWMLDRAVSPRRRLANGLATSWMVGSLLFALVPVVVIAVYVVSKGAGVMSLSFLTKNLPIVTQFPGGGRTDRNVHGIRFWPSYATESVGLFFGVASVLTLLGGLAQINPIWLYGPFRVANVTGPAQPDWYLGWLEGALRMFPAWEVRIGGVVIPNPFFPAVLLPGITFMMLYAWPLLERRFTGDYAAHHLLERPHDRPVRTALGVAALAFYVVLFLAGSNDLIAKWFGMPVETVTWVLRIGVIVVPVVAGYVMYWLMSAYRRSGASQFTKVPLAYFRHPRRGPLPRARI